MGLLLEAVDVTGPLRWRWQLSDGATGRPLADFPVDLATQPAEVARFANLYGYVRSYAAPDRMVADGARFVADAGAWAGREVLGDPIGSAILAAAAARPVTVRVRVPAALDPVLQWPLELAHAGGIPLAARGEVTFVYDIGPQAHANEDESPAALRVLAVFSQPTRTSVLALRRERYALTRLIRQVALKNAVIDLRVVQYGVTRARLERIAAEGGGWDVLHLAGHGAGGVFTLEQADGSPDPVPMADLVGLLRPARSRLRLAVVSACESAAAATAETYRLLGLNEQAEALEAEARESEAAPGGLAAPPAAGVPVLARALARELGCAVIGMRYPVADEFAIAFGSALYEQVMGQGNAIDVAVARAVAEAAGAAPSAARPALSLVTPGVFGAAAIGLKLAVPRGRPDFDPAGLPMAYFPDEPERFVGRAQAMARASAALAPGSGQTAVLLHGMAGAGKTACALELAYRHQDAFAAAAFWQAPTQREEWASALPDLANRLDIQLGDYQFTMASHIGTAERLAAFLPRLRAILAERGLLLVLDNLETLLTRDGDWRDPRWELLIGALTSHGGESRVILTSQIAPAGLAARPTAGPVVMLAVHALSLDEAVALARELPNLRALLHAGAGPDRPATRHDGAASDGTPADAATDRERVRRVLRIVQGHPKLMELADAAAADRGRLDARLDAAEAQARQSEAGPGWEAFFRDGTTTLDPGQFLDALTEWTTGALQALPADVRLMAEFVACLEDGDRLSYVIEATWAPLRERLARAGDPPAPRPLLDALADAALAEAAAIVLPGASGQAGAGASDPGAVPDSASRPAASGQAGAGPGQVSPASMDGPVPVGYRVHPGVAAAIMAAADPGVREGTDFVLAAFWGEVSGVAREREGGEDGGLVVRAGLAAAPYLLRRGDWRIASVLLEQATARDAAPGTVQAALPSLRRIADATGLPVDAVVLARVLMGVDPAGAERLLRGAVDAAAEAGDFRVASTGAAPLITLLRDGGRLGEALEVAGHRAEFTRQAGLGPWTQLGDQAQRLQVLGLLGEHARVLAETEGLRAAMAALPVRPGPGEAGNPWNVREVILGVGSMSALALGEWARCLELNAEVMASRRGRGAGAYEVAMFRFNDAVPLVRLGRLAEAGRLLAECQRVFEEHADTGQVAKVLTARADLEDALGRPEAAAELERAALRLRYARPEPEGIAVSHHNLALYLGWLGGDRAGQRAHRLAATLIYRLAGMAHDLADAVRVLAAESGADGGDPSLPSTVAQVVVTAERTEGVRLGALLAAMQPDPRALEDALAGILRAAAELPPQAGQPGTVAGG